MKTSSVGGAYTACQELVCVERTADPANHLPAGTLRTSAGKWQAGDVLDRSVWVQDLSSPRAVLHLFRRNLPQHAVSGCGL